MCIRDSPDRDYYTKTDDKSKETRARYLQHVANLFELMGDTIEIARQSADSVMRTETALAEASLTRVERRDPYKRKHKMNVVELGKLAPAFDWTTYYRESHYPAFDIVNVESPEFLKEVNALVASMPIDTWKTYLRFQVVNSASPYLSSAFVNERFEFYNKHLRGTKELQPRWKRCVSYTNHNLDDALGQVYVAKVFSPELKQSTLDMVQRIEAAMEQRIHDLDWMSPETKQQALAKLHGIRNKICLLYTSRCV